MKKTISLMLVLTLCMVAKVTKADFTFGEPANLGPTVNTPYVDMPSCISAEGLELYIFSNRPGTLGDTDIWVLTRTTKEDDWEPAVNLGPGVNSSMMENFGCLSADGLELFFASYNRPGGYGAFDVWVSSRQTRNDPWGTPANLGPPINSSSHDGSPGLSADGLEFYFSSQRPGGQGYSDLWVAKRAATHDPWEEPFNLGPVVNSSARELGVKVSSDSLAFFFGGDIYSPYRSGGFGLSDIWMTKRQTSERMPEGYWNEPVNLGALVNSASQDWGPVISHDGETLYFGSNRPGGSGDYDIYQVSVIPIVDFNGDSIVDAADMCIMVDYWGTDEALCDIGPMPWGDGIVDVQDLVVLAEHLFEEVP